MRNLWLSILFLFGTLLFFSMIYGEQNWQSFPDIEGNIKKGVLDLDGEIWFASDNGLYRYNGYEVINYNLHNSPLINNRINDLAVDANNVVWIATNDGLFSFDHGFWWHYTSNNSFLFCDFVRLLAIDLNNNLGVHTNCDPYYDFYDNFDLSLISLNPSLSRCSGIIHRVNMETMQLITSHSYILATFLVVDSNNVLWFNTREDIFFPADPPFLVFIDVIYTSENVSFYYMDFISYYLSVNGRIIKAIYPDNNGFWIGTAESFFYGRSESSVFFYENEEISNIYDTSNSDLPHSEVTALFKENNTLWIGTKGGVARVINDDWEVFTIDNSTLPSNRIKYIFEDSGSRIWFITDNGIAVYGQELGVEEEFSEATPVLTLYPAYPNPFFLSSSAKQAGGINIRYNLARDTHIKIDVFNIRGQHIVNITDHFGFKGEHLSIWQGVDRNGKIVSPGVYFYRIETEQASGTGKILLIR